MDGADTYVITIKGPAGEKQIAIPVEQVEFFSGRECADPYATATYLAYLDLWATM